MNKKLFSNSVTYVIVGLILIAVFYLFLNRSFEGSTEKDLGHLVRISKSSEGTASPVNIQVNGDKLVYTKNSETFKATKEPGTSVYDIMEASNVDSSAYSSNVSIVKSNSSANIIIDSISSL